MNLISSLKAHLLDKVEYLGKNPDRCLVFVERGALVWVGIGLSHEQRYTAIVEIDEWPDLDPNLIVAPLIEWYQANQDPIYKIDESRITFETFILSNKTTTVVFALLLHEAIVVSIDQNGDYQTNSCPV